jgi:5-amino-6-(5-phosphoribosylamino)uracil reductase
MCIARRAAMDLDGTTQRSHPSTGGTCQDRRMRVLYPGAGEAEPRALYELEPPAGRAAARPWVVVNMIASVDGAVAVDGRSGALGRAGDKAVFQALRDQADVVLVGAGTVRAERYGPPRRHGLRIAVVSARLDLDWGSPLFTSGRALVVTSEGAGDVPGHVPVLRAGDDDVDLRGVVAELGRGGARIVVAEGGPTLNGHLLQADLVDEVCTTVAPMLAGGRSGRLAVSDTPHLSPLQLRQVVTDDDGYLFLRYARPEGS